jgi:dephospho-CoA kinase
MIIGVTGTNGAGKGTVVDYLAKEKDFKHYSVREFLYEEIDRRGLERNRNSTNIVGNDLREKFGAGYPVEQLYLRAKEQGGNAVIESIRTVGEVEFLKSHEVALWGVDADQQVRYERSVLRKSELDRISFEKFCELEDLEYRNADPAKHNVLGVMAMADTTLYNNGSVQDLYAQVEEALKAHGTDNR